MDKNAVLKIIHRFKKAVESRDVTIKQIILFGSFKDGTFREDSDIDLVVISDDFDGMDYWQRIDILSEAIYEVFEPIEAVAITSNEWNRRESLVVDYARNGEVVYVAA
jgi:predicted nucleotidyltransferase